MMQQPQREEQSQTTQDQTLHESLEEQHFSMLYQSKVRKEKID